MTPEADRIAGTRSEDPYLSVVVVTYDEAENVESCLRSILRASSSLPNVEIVLVDSRSTDDTVARAAEFPVGIHVLPEEPGRTPGAARYVGTAVTSGDLLLFVDGDVVVEAGWLEAACERVWSTPELAGVDGHLNDADAAEDESVTSLRGVAVYDRAALADVGGFDPSLQALEDVELGYRLREAGYELRRLPDVVAHHPFDDGLGETLRRWSRGYYRARGQVVRKSLDSPATLRRIAWRSRLYLAGAAWAVVAAIAVVAGGPAVRTSALFATGFALASLAAVRGPRWTVHKAVSFVPVYAGAILGFLGEHPPASAYPLEDVETIRSQDVLRPEESTPRP